MANNIDKEIANIDKSICRHIDNIIIDSRGEVSQDTVGDLRHYVEHIMFKIYCIDKNLSLDIEFSNIKSVTKYISSKGNYKYKLLKNFHKMLQSSVSHYKPTEEDSERLMLKYYEYLFRIRKMMKEDYDLDLLHNLEKFPLNSDSEFREYYQKIADEVDKYRTGVLRDTDRFYIHKIKPFFMNGDIYYEVTFSPANDKSSKTDRNIAFTKIQIESNYASKMNFVNSNIETRGHKMPILVIVGWEISIRECEFNNFLKLIKGNNKENKIGPSEKMALCLFMTKSKLNLLDIVELEDSKYELLKRNLLMRARITNFFDALDICRDIIGNNKSGKNILRYLLFTMNNIIIKNQQGPSQNANLSDLYIKNGARPFDRTPFNFSLMGHNPPFHILTNCFEADKYQPEMLARYVKNNTECNGVLFTSLKDIDQPEEKYRN